MKLTVEFERTERNYTKSSAVWDFLLFFVCLTYAINAFLDAHYVYGTWATVLVICNLWSIVKGFKKNKKRKEV
jgi:heme O synthase-like polyprenyltransferase